MEGSNEIKVKPNFLNKDQQDLLSITQQFGKPELLNDRFWITSKVELSPNYHSLVIAFYKSDKTVERHLVNYTLGWKPISSLKVTSFFNKSNFESFNLSKWEVTVVNKKGAYSHVVKFLINSKGEFIPFVYPSLASLRTKGFYVDLRAVKAFNGLVFRDSLGIRMGKFNFGDDVYVLSYAEDSIIITDKGKSIKTRRAKVILDMDAFYKHSTLQEITYSFAFVAECYLFKNWFDDSKYGEEYYEIHPEDILMREFYENDFISAGDNYSEADINLLEVLDIRKVERGNFEDQIILKQNFDTEGYRNPDHKIVRIIFNNAKKRELRDTTYENMEYSPSRHFEKIEFSSQPNTLLIHESFFEDNWFTLLDLGNGDTISQFDGYPFYSPNQKWIVNFNTPLDYNSESAAFQLKHRNSEKYISCARINFTGWNLPKVLEILWLSESEFLVKVIRVKESYDDKAERKPYYLKFKILLED